MAESAAEAQAPAAEAPAAEAPAAEAAAAAAEAGSPTGKAAKIAAHAEIAAALADRRELLSAFGKKMKPPGQGHQFWSTQPVPHEGGGGPEGPIDKEKTPADVRQEPLDLPDGLEWWTPDVQDSPTMTRVYELLRGHYVEDDDAMFRFQYSEEFLRWALLPPKYKPEWHVAIRSKEDRDGELIGFITGIPVHIRVGSTAKKMCEINFLCVNKRTRDQGLAPLLIQEVTRRVNLEGVWQAVYTAGVVLPTPIGRCQYWHRSLNPQKLVQIKFSSIPRKYNAFKRPIDQMKKHYSLPENPKIEGLKPMGKKDVKHVRALLEEYLKKFYIAPVFTNAEIQHWFASRPDVIDTYVVKDEEGKVTDLLSFYSLPSTVIAQGRHKLLRAAYSYYNVSTTRPFHELLENALILARKQEFDVFNALDIMDNKETFETLKFGPGDGHLQYYLFNWRAREQLQPQDIGLVLL
eukprot:TRINITY_DN3528_c3_g1_i1.p1 TRINITY_DN3528_c3_g1~~TRINITY_DN3528_c3_g1_i1.p1  ORF type:complete len:484 (+),score=200.53 TRINITY_DN3528_c3_g1_i1:67-1452(+)